MPGLRDGDVRLDREGVVFGDSGMSGLRDPVGGVAMISVDIPNDRATERFVRQLAEAYPNYSITSQIGPDDNLYFMIQVHDGERNGEAPGKFLELVEEFEQ